MSTPVVTNILKTGAISYIAPEGEALPAKTMTAGTAWGGNWERMGFTKEPLKLAYEGENADQEVEEVLAAVARTKVKETASIETVLAEFALDYLQFGTDGTVTTVTATALVPGSEEIEIGNDAKKTVYALGFEGTRYDENDVALPVRIFIPRCTISLNGELEFSKKSDDYTGISLKADGLGDPSTGRILRIYRITAPVTA